jgi:hypothetical protein
MAYKLNPSETKYLKSWALFDSKSDEVAKILDGVLQKDPTNAFAAYMVAGRTDTPPEKAIELLSGTQGCVAGQGDLLGELLEKRKELERARNAYKMELYGRCETIVFTWHGSELRLEGETRFNLARVSLALGDLYGSLRQLRFLQRLTRDAALTLVDFEQMEDLDNQLVKQLKKKPLAKPGNLHTPGEVILAFERMAVLGDARGFKSHISSECHWVFQSDEDGHKGCADGDALCLLDALQEFLPRETIEINCGKIKDGRTQCSVAGTQSWDVWNVELVKAKGTWKVFDSKRFEE